ncbi:MAG: hypothetical protein A3A80_01430 [Candidatus Terrybacteria bacterium RIFCSPLOWO2_01_FULL_44_24]|uniref:Photosynthesis system II assembly factor Ycf48/Hcf136-like domain-containing protein n=1 Tax=Candidatus Terrybacteria bacterium RIFCSPHIGHO2_01_FULL_43_35 TaxID=1802361 RepID=A0A1G2PFJ7_9BACT|nr:MAG: hypothetical protein A2828_03805 [Candidatus Terrybacteria bacterium RIFCSPHIGHO2_01_FULL_43_35]OHA49937.1 MAG: hypothetical protein A3B75_03495 [Candidatus Terrybacteria bacterium RIFCSPHIGHO2_02_FULL_43_14]OHA51742.1 MAG: hypothetical protein A3A80_01430 [Candidatus Terrybacteria bacterium RIFCSPLOWO2_01_FULL_44_24]
MQTAFKIIIISFFIALISAGVGIVLKGNKLTSSSSGPGTPVSGSGILYSEDMGNTWIQRSQVSQGQNISRFDITDIVIYPKDTSIVFAGTSGGGLFRSRDSGQNWDNISDANKVLTNRAVIKSIAVDSEDSKNLFVAAYQGTRGSILRSQDGGDSFTELFFTSRSKAAVNAVIFSFNDHKQVFAGTDEGLVLESIDNGNSWRTIGEFAYPVRKLAHTSAGVLIAVVQNKGLLRSSDFGANWLSSEDTTTGKKLESFASGINIEYMALDPQNPNNIYLGTGYGLLRSRDGGISFDAPPVVIPPRSLPVMSVGVSSNDSRIILVGAGQAIYRSQDGGEHWSLHAVPTNKRLRVMTVFPHEGSKIFLGLSR